MAKYNKVKKALFGFKDKAKQEEKMNSNAESKLIKLQKEFDSLNTEFKTISKQSSEREKMWKKKSEKLKQLLEKKKKDCDNKEEEIKEQKKQIAGFTKAAEEFDQQRRLAADREKELLENRTN